MAVIVLIFVLFIVVGLLVNYYVPDRVDQSVIDPKSTSDRDAIVKGNRMAGKK